MKQKLLSIIALLLAAVSGAWAQDTYNVTFKANGKTVTKENVTLPWTVKCDYYNSNDDELDKIIQELYELSGGWCGEVPPSSSGSENVICGQMNTFEHFITVSAPFEGTATVAGIYYNEEGGGVDFNYSLEISIPGYVAKVNVTGVTLSQASAEMAVGGDALTLTATVANGVVTAVAAGTATITATATNGTDDTSDDFSATDASVYDLQGRA